MYSLALFLCALLTVQGHEIYLAKIPNGHNVKLADGTSWLAVGHTDRAGHGARNVFGVAFKNAGHTWTDELCRADSDGDGLTNGQELGDPACTWAHTGNVARSTNITHPGLCEPQDLPKCVDANTQADCGSSSSDSSEDCDPPANTDKVGNTDNTGNGIGVGAAGQTSAASGTDGHRNSLKKSSFDEAAIIGFCVGILALLLIVGFAVKAFLYFRKPKDEMTTDLIK